MEKFRLEQLVKRYNDWALRMDLRVHAGEIMTLLGPSGCGKTTTLRIVAGFIRHDGGHVCLDDVVIDDVPPYQRNIGVVFQDYALFPHMNVFKNIAFGMKMKRHSTKAQVRDRVEELLALVGLDGYEHRYPDQLSGGEQQRIALLRALAPYPKILLLDEPLSALDFQLRKRLRQEIKNVQRRLGITMLYVTHDQEEAMSLSDRIAVMRNGKVEQLGSPVEIYQNPQTEYVASFVGISNVLSGTLVAREGDRLVVETAHARFTISGSPEVQRMQRIRFFFRPEDSFLSSRPEEANVIRGTIVEHEYLGAEILTTIQSRNRESFLVSAYIKNEDAPGREGENVYINIPADACRIIQEETDGGQ